MGNLFDDDQNADDSSDFAKMFEDSMAGGSSAVDRKLKAGDRIKGEILTIGKEDVFVSTGTMDDGVAMKSELLTPEGEFKYKVGDTIDLFVTQVRGGQVFLSPKATAKNMAEDLEDAFDMMLPVEGKVTELCNGGFRVSLMGQTAFCPVSQMDIRRIDDQESYIGRKLEFQITQYSNRGRNIVVSRRRLLEDQKELTQAAFTEDNKIGDILTGTVTRLEKFGAFVEIAPGIEGLVHISEIAWSRLNHPNEALQVGALVSAKLLKIEEVNGRTNISLSIKQGLAQPWENMPATIREGSVVQGKVTRCMKFGAFVEVAPGIEGLVPLSEMSYTKRVMRAEDVVNEGEKVQVMIKEIRLEERRLLLSIRDAGGDPWEMAPMKFPEGSVVKGRIERREAYGLFVKLDEGIVGLLPKSKAMEVSDFAYDKVKIGDEITVEITELKPADRRVSLAVPLDPNAEVWKGFAAAGAGPATDKSLGTLGDQFKGLFGATTASQGSKKK